MGVKTPEELRTEFWEKDLEQGAVIYNQYTEIKRILASSDMDWVRQHFKMIKNHAIVNTEFYKRYSIDDKFPVMDKMTLINQYENHMAKSNFTLPTHTSSTSGSTGTPFSVIQDYNKRKRTIADLKVFGELCDYPSHERMVFFRVMSDKLHRTQEQEDRENIYYIDSSDLGAQHLHNMLQAILEKEPRIILSYSSTLVELAKYIASIGMTSDKFSVKSVLTIGEGLTDENRPLLQNVFGCKIYRRYSDMELGILGQDTGDGGAYILNWGSYYFECLKIDSDEPAEAGEPGRIVVTDLFNYAFPMIRYDTGDLGIMEYPKDDFPYLKEIFGRSRDCVYAVDGTLLSPAKLSVAMWGIQGIKQWQFIQETKNEYVLKLNYEGAINCNSLIEKFKCILGEKAIITIQRV